MRSSGLDGFASADLGYPTFAELAHGTLLVSYYGQDNSGVTCIWGTVIELSA